MAAILSEQIIPLRFYGREFWNLFLELFSSGFSKSLLINKFDSLLFSLLLMSRQILYFRLKFAYTHSLSSELLNFIFMNDLVLTLFFTQIINFLNVLFTPSLHRVELAGYWGEINYFFVFLNELSSDATEFIGWNLRARLGQTKLIFQLLDLGSECACGNRFILVMLCTHLLELLF